MGELYFETSARKLLNIGLALFSFVVSAVAASYLIGWFQSINMILKVILFLIVAGLFLFGISEIMDIFRNKLSLYEKGIIAKKGSKTNIIFLTDIVKVNITERNGSNYSLDFEFELKDNNIVYIGSDDYKNFPELMKKYGKKFGYDWSFR